LICSLTILSHPEALLFLRLLSDEIELITEAQTGFRKGYGTTDNSFTLYALFSIYPQRISSSVIGEFKILLMFSCGILSKSISTSSSPSGVSF
jgi:hypothetical protein